MPVEHGSDYESDPCDIEETTKGKYGEPDPCEVTTKAKYGGTTPTTKTKYGGTTPTTKAKYGDTTHPPTTKAKYGEDEVECSWTKWRMYAYICILLKTDSFEFRI